MSVDPPGGRTRENRKFIQAPSPEIWRKTISGTEGGSGEEVGWPVLGYLLGKIIGGVTAIVSYRPGGCVQESTVPWCAILLVGSTGVTSSEAPRVHIACRRCGVAGRGARTAAGDAGDWVPQHPITKQLGPRFFRCVPPRSCRSRVRRWPK